MKYGAWTPVIRMKENEIWGLEPSDHHEREKYEAWNPVFSMKENEIWGLEPSVPDERE